MVRTSSTWLRQLPQSHAQQILSAAGLPPVYSNLLRNTSDLIRGVPYYWRQRLCEDIAQDVTMQYNPLPASNLQTRNGLFIVDVQDTFCKEMAAQLYVPGSEDMLERFLPWMGRNALAFSRVWSTIDSHVLMQIFHRYRYRHSQTGMWAEAMKPLPTGVAPYQDRFAEPIVRAYQDELARKGSAPLMIWNAHSLLGEKGNSLTTLLYEILAIRDLVLQDQTVMRPKGLSFNSEAYGALSDEVTEVTVNFGDGRGDVREIIGQSSPDLLEAVAEVDRMFVVGVAGDFCVKSTAHQLYKATQRKDPAAIKKMYIVSDATAYVFRDGVIPGIGKVLPSETEINDEYRKLGVNVVTMQEVETLLMS